LGLSYNITERKKQEDQLRFQSQILNQIEEAIIATDENQKVVFWNNAAEKLYGYKSEEVIGKNIVDVTPAIEVRAESQEIIDAIHEGQNWNGDFSIKTKSGEALNVRVRNSPIKDATGQILGIVGISTDITNLRIVENELKKANQFLEKAGEIARVGAWEVDLKKNEVFWSNTTRAIHEIPPDYDPTLAGTKFL